METSPILKSETFNYKISQNNLNKKNHEQIQNLKKSLTLHFNEAQDLELFRTKLKRSISEKQYSWFELWYDHDLKNRDFVNLVESFIYKTK